MYRKQFKNNLKKQFVNWNFNNNFYLFNYFSMKKQNIIKFFSSILLILGVLLSMQTFIFWNVNAFFEDAKNNYSQFLKNNIIYQNIISSKWKDYEKFINLKNGNWDFFENFKEVSIESWMTKNKVLTKSSDWKIFLDVLDKHFNNIDNTDDSMSMWTTKWNGDNNLIIDLSSKVQVWLATNELNDLNGDKFEEVTGLIVSKNEIISNNDIINLSDTSDFWLAVEGEKTVDSIDAIGINLNDNIETNELVEIEESFLIEDLSWINLMPKIEKMVKVWSAEFIGESKIDNKKVLWFKLNFVNSKINDSLTKNYEYFYFNKKTKKLVQISSIIELDDIKYELFVQKIIKEEILNLKDSKKLFNPSKYNLKEKDFIFDSTY